MSRVLKIQSMVRERRRALKETNSVKLSRMEDMERHDFTETVSTNATRNLSTGRKMAKNIAKCAVITTSVTLDVVDPLWHLLWAVHWLSLMQSLHFDACLYLHNASCNSQRHRRIYHCKLLFVTERRELKMVWKHWIEKHFSFKRKNKKDYYYINCVFPWEKLSQHSYENDIFHSRVFDIVNQLLTRH